VTKNQIPKTRNEIRCLIPVSESCDRKPSILDLSTDPGIFEFSPVEADGGRLEAADNGVEFLQVLREKSGTVLSKRLTVGRVSREEEKAFWRFIRWFREWLKVKERGADHPHIVEAKFMALLFVPWIPEGEVAVSGQTAGFKIVKWYARPKTPSVLDETLNWYRDFESAVASQNPRVAVHFVVQGLVPDQANQRTVPKIRHFRHQSYQDTGTDSLVLGCGLCLNSAWAE